MRIAVLLVTAALGIATTVAVTAQQGERAEPAATHRAVVPGLATDGQRTLCTFVAEDPCPLPVVTLTVRSADSARSVALAAEIARLPDQRQRGLMFRESLADDAAMLFVFAQEFSGGFWMWNTFIPLDIAYLGADGTVLQIVHGVPLSIEVLTADQPYLYALEVAGGWFERHDLGVGDRVIIPPYVTTDR